MNLSVISYALADLGEGLGEQGGFTVEHSIHAYSSLPQQ